jgi:hypothetical protein
VAETRVVLHFEDLRDAYPGAIEETTYRNHRQLARLGATLIRLAADSAGASLTITDNGSGMPRRDLRRYHDLAASTKARGQGIGFAGVGIKLALLACREVVTETRRGKVHVATGWHLASRHRAPWRWIPAPGLVAERGTAVRLNLADPLSPLTDRGYVEGAIRRHYEPRWTLPRLHARRALRTRHQRTASCCPSRPAAPPKLLLLRFTPAAGASPPRSVTSIATPCRCPKNNAALPYTYGKIIKRGWDWLGISPHAPERIGGLIEFPMLAASLTLNKGDFIRSGHRGAAYLAARKAIQEVVQRQLTAWGDAREQPETARPRAMRSLERDLERVLRELSEGFPLLASLVEHRRGGQKSLPLGTRSGPDGSAGFDPALALSPMNPPGGRHGYRCATVPRAIRGDAARSAGRPAARGRISDDGRRIAEVARRTAADAARSCSAVRGASGRFGTRAPDRIDGIHQPRTPGVSARGSVAVGGLPHRVSVRRAGPARRRTSGEHAFVTTFSRAGARQCPALPRGAKAVNGNGFPPLRRVSRILHHRDVTTRGARDFILEFTHRVAVRLRELVHFGRGDA